ncbi:hypothetical protein [Citrobacter portucalensis]|uniref:hypothetical protein n=1 Tax=Citrobacter portucalensis TaxID=1639133 RepID=UPI002FE6B3AA
MINKFKNLLFLLLCLKNAGLRGRGRGRGRGQNHNQNDKNRGFQILFSHGQVDPGDFPSGTGAVVNRASTAVSALRASIPGCRKGSLQHP